MSVANLITIGRGALIAPVLVLLLSGKRVAAAILFAVVCAGDIVDGRVARARGERLIQSPWYQRRWADVFTLTGDQNAKTRFDNDASGYRLATGVGGSITGEGGDIVVCDDPHKILEAESGAQRETVLTWWDETMSTRLNGPRTGAKVIVMQRLHERDLSGHVLEQGGYEHLCLPAEYEPTLHVTSIGRSDPRRESGVLLWATRYGRDEIDALKRVLGPYGTAGQLQKSSLEDLRRRRFDK